MPCWLKMASVRGFTKNIPFIRQQFVALLGNTSLSVKFICVVVLCCYFFSFSEEAVRVLSVTPGYLLPPVFWIWTAFTYCFLELHFWEVCVDIITVGLCGKLIEPLWGAFEMMTFFAITNIGVALLSALFYLILYMCTFNPDLLFTVHIHGLAGYIAGVSVAVKQIMPDHIILKTPLGKLTNRNVPLSVLFMSLVLWLIGLLEGTYPTMFMSGLLVSWTYLRFYQYHTNGTRGDIADNFTFASFFPNVLQPPIAVLSNTVHGFLVRMGICRRMVRRYDMSAPAGITISLPGIDPQDMERRRQIALKALSERLSKVEPLPAPASAAWEQQQQQQQQQQQKQQQKQQDQQKQQQQVVSDSTSVSINISDSKTTEPPQTTLPPQT
ncbi:transmembrane protein 115 [Schistocerca gregaria]|uniref:transmembrane protein 115 n=1 Tax=Schistocerca gregaria TaxID=7010 RepID=UPI00211DED0F|nr:transmembrane protein 115 [Schistocerca gregaria]